MLLKPSYFGVVKACYLSVKDGSIVGMVLGVLTSVDLASLVLRNTSAEPAALCVVREDTPTPGKHYAWVNHRRAYFC